MNPLDFTQEEAADQVGRRLQGIPFPPLGELTIREYFEALDPLYAQMVFAYNQLPAPIDPLGGLPLMLLFRLTGKGEHSPVELERMYTDMATTLRSRYLSGDIDGDHPKWAEDTQ
jgi:hypothetical protein